MKPGTMPEQQSDDCQARLETAFRKLDYVPSARSELFLQSGLNHLSLVNAEGPGTMPKQYRTNPKGGRPPNSRAQAIAVITGYTYFQLTGRKPALTIPVELDTYQPGGVFFNLLQDVLGIFGLEHNVEHLVKELAASFQMPPSSSQD